MAFEQEIKKAIDTGVTAFAVTTFRNRERIFGIKTDDRRRHVYVIGKTGMGKTTLIENMVYSDIMAGHGVCYVDPHGDTAEKMLQWIPSKRINDVIYFNPADIENPISFNVLEKVAPEYRHLVASGLIGVFKKLWADSWGPRLEYLLRNAILALLEYPDSTLLGINRLLTDKEYRQKVVSKVQDPVIRSFWTDEYTKYGPQFQVEAISPIQNKIGQFLSTALIRNVVGQVKSTIDLRKAMDEGKILILNLSKGRIGEDASALLGSMMVTKIQLAAMSRVDILEETRNDFYLFVDEFQNFATDAFANILSEARKYRLNLIIAHQYIEQLGEVVTPAVFGNVGTIICFRVGAADAEFLEKEFAPDLIPEDLVNLPKHHIYLKLMIDGVTSEPFSAKGLPPVYSSSLGNEEKVIRASRERYAKPRDIVEDKIRRWSFGTKDEEKLSDKDKRAGITVDVFGKKREGGKSERSDGSANKYKDDSAAGKSTQPGFQGVCANCQVSVDVPFKPDGIRPIYCKDCLKKARRGEIKMVKPVQKEVVVPEEKIKEPAVSLAQITKQTVNFKGKSVAEPKREVKKEEKVLPKTDETWKKEIVKPWEIKTSSTSADAKALSEKKVTVDRPVSVEKKVEKIVTPSTPKPVIKPAPIIRKEPEIIKVPPVVVRKPEVKIEAKVQTVKIGQPVVKVAAVIPKVEETKKWVEPVVAIPDIKPDVPKPKEEEPPKENLPSVDLLGFQNNDSKEVKEGEVVEF